MDLIAIKLRLCNKHHCYISRPIPHSMNMVTYSRHTMCATMFDGNMLLLGAFNISNYVICFNKHNLRLPKVTQLNIFLEFNSLSQFNMITNSHNNILDIIMRNKRCTIYESQDYLTGEDEHHPVLCVNCEFSNNLKKPYFSSMSTKSN